MALQLFKSGHLTSAADLPSPTFLRFVGSPSSPAGPPSPRSRMVGDHRPAEFVSSGPQCTGHPLAVRSSLSGSSSPEGKCKCWRWGTRLGPSWIKVKIIDFCPLVNMCVCVKTSMGPFWSMVIPVSYSPFIGEISFDLIYLSRTNVKNPQFISLTSIEGDQAGSQHSDTNACYCMSSKKLTLPSLVGVGKRFGDPLCEPFPLS